ncbi:MAG: MarR family transcriptional regulator [Anaerolineae bacterium]|nr:MarR family transcriptional regulator [Anaerolineae bacterium]
MSKDKKKMGQLLGNVGRLHAKRADQFMSEMGLYRGQAILLIILSEHDGITHSEIAEKLNISPAAATKVIKRLEKFQYLKRQADAQDERVSHLYLLEDGRLMLNKIIGVFKKLEEISYTGFSEEEKNTFINMLVRIQNNLIESEAENQSDPASPR